MDFTINTQSFHQIRNDLEDADGNPERKKFVLDKYGMSQEDLDKFNQEYTQNFVPLVKKDVDDYLFKVGGPEARVSHLNEDQRGELESLIHDKIEEQSGLATDLLHQNLLQRILGRGVNEFATGIVEVADFALDQLPYGEAATKLIADGAEALYEGAVPDEARRYFAEVFDPYHGAPDSLATDLEQLAGVGSSMALGGGVVVKGLKYGARALGATNSPLGRAAINSISRQPTSLAGKVAKGGAMGAAFGAASAFGAPAVVSRESLADLYDIEGADKMDRGEFYSNYLKQAGAEEAIFGAGFGVAAPLVGKYAKPLAVAGVKNTGKLLSDVGKHLNLDKGFNTVVNASKMHLTSRRGLSEGAFDLTIKREGAGSVALDKAEGLTNDLKLAAKRELGADNAERYRETWINWALQGKQRAIRKLEAEAPETLEIIKKMRANIDDASRLNAANFVDGSPLKAVIDSNYGLYLNRSYRVFDDPEFKAQVLKQLDGTNAAEGDVIAAMNYIKRQVGGDDDKAKAVLLGLIGETPTQQVERELNMLKGEFFGTSKVYRKRDNIPPVMRKFYGEIKDPTTQYAKTMEKLAIINGEYNFQKELLEDLRATGLATTKEDALRGGYTEADFVNLGGVGADRLQRTFGMNNMNSLKNPLEDIVMLKEDAAPYTHAIRNGLEGLFSDVEHKGLGKLFNYWARYKATSQAAKTVWNPATHMANTIGQVTLLAANGFLPNPKGAPLKKAADATARKLGLKPEFDPQNSTVKTLFTRLAKSNEETGKYLGRLQELGVVDSGVAVGEIKKNFGSWADKGVGMLDDMQGNKYLRPLKKFNRKLMDVYQAEDDMFKIIHFESMKEVLQEAHPLKSLDEIESMAARRTRDEMPNYQLANNAVKTLRVSPFGDFVSWPAELMRVTKNMTLNAVADARSGNRVLQRYAARRLGSMVAVGSIPSIATTYSMSAHGIDQDQEDALNAIAPNYEAFSNRIYLSGKTTDVNGHEGYDYIRLSSQDPFDYIKSGVRAGITALVADTEPEVDKALHALLENQLAPFIGTSMVTDAGVKMFGVAGDRQPITSENTLPYTLSEAGLPDVLAKGLGYALEPVKPGFVNYLQRKAEYENSGMRSRSASTINPSDADALRGMFGFGAKRIDLTANLNFALTPQEARMNKATEALNREIQNPNTTKEAVLKAFTRMQEESYKAQQNIKVIFDSYQNMGVDAKDIHRAMSNQRNPIQQKSRMKMFYKIGSNTFIPQFFSESQFAKASNMGLELPQEEAQEIMREWMNKPLLETKSIK